MSEEIKRGPYADGCVYNRQGVVCKVRGRCEGCGWNPEEREKRNAQLKESGRCRRTGGEKA